MVILIPCSASAGAISSRNVRAWRSSCARTVRAISSSILRRRQSVRPAGVDPRVDLVVHAGDADHEVLVEVGDEDRQELEPLDQRHRSSSASCSTRSLNSSHDSSRLMYSALSLEVGGGRRLDAVDASVAHRACSRGSPTGRPPAAAIALSSEGRSSTISSPFSTPASPPLRIRTCAPVMSCSVERERRIVADEQHLAAAGGQLGCVERLPRQGRALLDLDLRVARMRARRSASRAPSGSTDRRRCARRAARARSPRRSPAARRAASAAARRRVALRPRPRVAAARSSQQLYAAS